MEQSKKNLRTVKRGEAKEATNESPKKLCLLGLFREKKSKKPETES